MEKTIKRTTQRQFETMVQLMERNPDLARGLAPFGSTKKNRMELWEGIASELNNIGPPIRSGSEWNKVWLDYKLKLKRKIADNRKEIAATGGIGWSYTQRSVTPLEQAVDELLSLQQAVNPSGAAFGSTAPTPAPAPAPTPAYVEEEHLEDVEVQPEQAANISISTRQAPTRVEERENLRMKALEKQADTQESLVGIMKNIHSVCNEISRYTRKIYELKKEKLVLYKMKEGRKY
uniref:Regulatory protein zeste n=4 Tax=Bactrocera latifrons TaxID=174628 RepID=A0A0K8VVS0_BACLA